MRWLIDGYNVMHAGGRLGPKLSREGFRRARRRFLDELAQTLGPEVAPLTTVVLDASVPPGDFPSESNYKGLSVLFALGEENADARIEALIRADSSPKSLTVVSSDNRIRLAASRRRCQWLTSEKYWELLDNLKEARAKKPAAPSGPPEPGSASQPENPRDDDSYWLGVFAELEQSAEIRQASTSGPQLLTDAEIEEIEREIEREG
jgi:uncharacterized protein